MSEASPTVTVTIDGKTVQVPKGTNIIEAAKRVGISIPHYCYHPHLSVAGNCRICKVEVEGMPKLQIGCNTGATEGMVVKTHNESEKVKEAQRATLEFILVNHPLDCTVCDQAGHCKLQDYYYDYNGKASRFIEEKEHKVKAEPIGPEVIYDGERCILCTRCVRFCDEVTQTSELGVFNRGDKAVIGIHPDKELDNPLSGSVVDLCPVGALTHRRWRFNTRIWYTNRENSVCAGCSTGCNVDLASRDGKIVQVKARLNSEVNQEWMCDEGRYGFDSFQPQERMTKATVREHDTRKIVSIDEAIKKANALFTNEARNDTAVFISPTVTLEELWLTMRFARDVLKLSPESGRIAMQVVIRQLSNVQKVLVSPDYAPNARAGTLFGLGDTGENWRESLQNRYYGLLDATRAGQIKKFVFVGDMSMRDVDFNQPFADALSKAEFSLSIGSRTPGNGMFESLCSVTIPGQTVNEKSGVFLNKDARLQRIQAVLNPPFETLPVWEAIRRIADSGNRSILSKDVFNERALFKAMVTDVPSFAGLTLQKIGSLGISLSDIATAVSENQAQAAE